MKNLFANRIKRFYSVENLVQKLVGQQDKTHEFSHDWKLKFHFNLSWNQTKLCTLSLKIWKSLKKKVTASKLKLFFGIIFFVVILTKVPKSIQRGRLLIRWELLILKTEKKKNERLSLRSYLSTIPTYNSHFNSHLNSHFLFSRSGNSFWRIPTFT